MSCFEELDALNPSAGYNGSRIETPTPHKVAVLMLVKEYLKAKKATTDAGLIYPPIWRRHFCLLILKLIQYPDMTYNDLHGLLTSQRYKIEPVHLEAFERAMADLFSLGIEALFDFAELQNIDKMLSMQLVSEYSIAGLYIRRVGLALERLTFPEMMALYKNICLYYEKGVRSLAIGPKKSSTTVAPVALQQPGSIHLKTDLIMTETPKSAVIESSLVEESIMDTETVHQDRNPHSKWSAKQADLFVTQQCNLLENNELRALTPIDMQTKLNEIIQDNPLHSQAYFLSYLNQLRLHDIFGATDALHRAFDRCPMQLMNQYEQKGQGFQYFCVNLAVLHATFNHRREALNALKECIMLAQDCGDKRCLDLANSWYCLLNSNCIDPFEKSLPDIQDPGLVQSLSLAIQYVVKFGAQCGYQPLDLFELLLKSDELNSKNSMLEHVSDSLSLRSALWCLYGRHEMSSLYGQMLLNLKKTWAFGDVGNSESVSKVLASLALWLNVQGEQQMSAIVLQHASERFPRYPNASNWMISESHIIIQQAIYRGRWHEAQKACCQLYLIDRNAAMLQRANIYVARRYFTTARLLLHRLLQNEDIDVLTQVRALVLLAHSTLTVDCVSSETVQLLVRASVLAGEAYMLYEQAVVDMILAEVFLLMGMPQKAFQAVTNCMETIYTNGGLYDRAKMNFTFVRCLVAAAGRDDKERKSRLMGSLNTMEKAVDNFKKLEAHAKVLDVYTYLAKMFNVLHDVELRNKYARKFRLHYMEFPVAREYLGTLY